MLLVAVLLVACGDDDDDADTDVAPTATTAAVAATTEPETADAESTPTEEPADEPTATTEPQPTEPAATPTEEAIETPTEEAVATPTADSTATDSDSTPEADETPASQVADPEVEAVLFEIALTEEDLPEGWTSAGMSASDETGADQGFCNAEKFAGIGERIASIDAEFEGSPDLGPFLIQNLAAYPEDLAIEAMEYVREVTSACTEWTDDEGVPYSLEVQEGYPQFGDESFVARITFEAPGVGSVPGEFVFIRVGELLSAVGYVDILEIDQAEVEELATLAAEKMQDADFSLDEHGH